MEKKKLMKKRNAPSHAQAPFCTDIAQYGSSRIAPNHPKPRNDHFFEKKSQIPSENTAFRKFDKQYLVFFCIVTMLSL